MIVLPGPHLPPVEAAGRLAGRPGRFLLHSGSAADGCGRWSFVGVEPERVLRDRARPGVFAALAELAAGDVDLRLGPVPTAVGYLGYDLGRAIERLPTTAVDDLHLPDLWFGRYGAVWRHDRETGRAEVVGESAAATRLHALLGEPVRDTPEPPRLGPLESERPAAAHLAAVGRALEYIRAGDIYQVNLARRLHAAIREPGDPLALYARLTAVAPAPFGALLETDDAVVISDSPELFLRRDPGSSRVETRPIKGTRARGSDAAQDAALADALGRDAKERAEHLMIVDLLRNDLGRVATTGSVVVEDFARLVSLPTVHHLVSTIVAETPGVGIAPLLEATFPGGSVTGAPKIRAMEIIDELEPVRRGIYTGALGWIGAGGALDLSIVIRTAVLARERLHLHVGGGIVADSTPARELEETEEKAAAWRRVLG